VKSHIASLAGALVSLTLASCGGSAATTGGSASAAASQPAGSLAQIVDAANKEGSVVIWGQYPLDSDVPKVQEAFNVRFKTNIKIQTVSISAPEAQTRMMAEAQGNRFDWDVFPNFGSESLPDLTDRGILAKVDWAPFQKELPDVSDAAGAVPAEFKGGALNFYDGGYGFFFNRDQMKAADMPKQWTDLADPKYRGKFAASSFGYPFNYLSVSPDWGPTKTEQLVRQVAANKPLLQGSASQLVDIVSRGEVPMGVSDFASILDGIGKSKPIQAVVPDVVPGDHRYTVIAAKAPHPNAARLYAAWEVSEGMKVYLELRQASRFSSPTSPVATLIKQSNPAAKIVYPASLADIKAQAAFLKPAAGILTGTN